MKDSLPANHGLPDRVVKSLIFHEDGGPSLTDAQFEALAQGVGRGESALVVSPTSTGKTHIALWASRFFSARSRVTRSSSARIRVRTRSD